MSLMHAKIENEYIKRSFLLKMGNLFVLPREENTSLAEEEIIEVFNVSDVVKKVETVDLTHSFTITSLLDPRSIRLGKPIMLHIELPIEKQEVSMIDLALFGEKSDSVSNFSITYDGTMYAICREVDFSKSLYLGGVPDVRNIFFDMIYEKKLFNVIKVPPNPRHENIYLVYVKDSEKANDYVGGTFKEEKSFSIYLSESQLEDHGKIVARLLRMTELEDYYKAKLSYGKLQTIAERIGEVHQIIQDVIDESMNTSFFHLLEHYRLTKKLEKLVYLHHSYLLSYSLGSEILRADIQSADEALRTDSIFKHYRNELLEELEIPRVDLDTLTKCVIFAKDFIQRSYATKATLFGALIGVVGTIIGTYLLNLLGL